MNAQELARLHFASDPHAEIDAQSTQTETDIASSKMLEHLASGSLGPLNRLRETIDLTLDQVADWIALPANRQRVGNLLTLLEAQTQLIICQQHLLAVAKLADLIANSKESETVRKACIDMLKTRLHRSGRGIEAGGRSARRRGTASDPLVVLEVLERLGRFRQPGK